APPDACRRSPRPRFEKGSSCRFARLEIAQGGPAPPVRRRPERTSPGNFAVSMGPTFSLLCEFIHRDRGRAARGRSRGPQIIGLEVKLSCELNDTWATDAGVCICPLAPVIGLRNGQ